MPNGIMRMVLWNPAQREQKGFGELRHLVLTLHLRPALR